MGVTGADRRKNRHDEQRDGRLVRRLHADARRRHLVRLRHAATDQHERIGRTARRAGVGRVLPGGLARAARLGVRSAARAWSRRSSIRKAASWRPSGAPRVRGSGTSRAASRRRSATCTREPPEGQIAADTNGNGPPDRGTTPSRRSAGASATFCGRSSTGSARPGSSQKLPGRSPDVARPVATGCRASATDCRRSRGTPRPSSPRRDA